MQETWSCRTEALLGEQAIQKLAAATVAVFGLGGVGSYTAEALARAGVGHLILIDGDTVADSNRNRQLCALTSTVGLSKAQVVAARVQDINPACRVQTHTLFYLPPDGVGLVDDCDYVADAIDTVKAKVGLAVECAEKGVPLISAMGCGNKLDATAFRVTDIAKTQVCPLCRVMRRELKLQGISHLKVVYSEEKPRTPQGAEHVRTPASVSYVPGAAGLIMAGEIIKSIAEVE